MAMTTKTRRRRVASAPHHNNSYNAESSNDDLNDNDNNDYHKVVVDIEGSSNNNNNNNNFVPSSSNNSHAVSTTTAATTPTLLNGDYYDDEDEKNNNPNQMYDGACNFGKFVLNPCWCLYEYCCQQSKKLQVKDKIIINNNSDSDNKYSKYASKNNHHHQQQQKMSMLLFPLSIQRFRFLRITSYITFIMALLFYFISTIAAIGKQQHYNFLSLLPSSFQQSIRPTTDDQLNNLDILIPKYQPQLMSLSNLGGWHFPQFFFLPHDDIATAAATSEDENIKQFWQPDYGQLIMSFAQGSIDSFARRINLKDYQQNELYRKDEILAEPKKRIPHYYRINEDILDEPQKCQRPNWKHMYHPACNAFHEIAMHRNYNDQQDPISSLKHDQGYYDNFYISHGYYRDAWVLDTNSFSRDHHREQSILKSVRFKYEYTISTLHSVLRDALIMERLTVSPNIIDIYGHCATSVWVEAMPYEVEEYIVPEGWIKQKDLHDEQQLQPQNDFTPTEKLEMALAMAESLAELHGFKDGVIVHDDVQLCQWLRNRQTKLKLGDFNRAEIMDYDVEKQEYCTYNNGEGFGNYRAPEEFSGSDLNEKIDVFSFGNNIYALLTGLWVFYENEDDGVVQKKVIAGETAFVDPRYESNSFAEAQLVKVMHRCWVYEPKDRIDIFEVVTILREAVKKNKEIMIQHEQAEKKNG